MHHSVTQLYVAVAARTETSSMSCVSLAHYSDACHNPLQHAHREHSELYIDERMRLGYVWVRYAQHFPQLHRLLDRSLGVVTINVGLHRTATKQRKRRNIESSGCDADVRCLLAYSSQLFTPREHNPTHSVNS